MGLKFSSLYKIRNRPSQIHCLNSDGTGDLSLLRYKPDFVTSLFAISELYCIILQDVFLFFRGSLSLLNMDKVFMCGLVSLLA